jgi:hypothetical protein
MFSLVLHATARDSRNGRVRGYRNMTIPELVKFASVDFWTVRWARTTLHQQIIRIASREAFTRRGSRWSRVSCCLAAD